MLRNLTISLGLILFCFSTVSLGKKIEGVEMPDSMEVSGKSLTLNGGGVRSKFFIDLYVGGLYLASKSSDAKAIVEADQPMAIRLHIISSLITSEKMIDAVVEGFDNATGGSTEAIQAHVDAFIGVFKSELKENDIFDIAYDPAGGVVISKNGSEVAVINGGMAFKKALFGIWLSDKPAQDSLKEEMLGG